MLSNNFNWRATQTEWLQIIVGEENIFATPECFAGWRERDMLRAWLLHLRDLTPRRSIYFGTIRNRLAQRKGLHVLLPPHGPQHRDLRLRPARGARCGLLRSQSHDGETPVARRCREITPEIWRSDGVGGAAHMGSSSDFTLAVGRRPGHNEGQERATSRPPTTSTRSVRRARPEAARASWVMPTRAWPRNEKFPVTF